MALTASQQNLLRRIRESPASLARMLGFGLLNDSLHNRWIQSMIYGSGDETLQAHRGSYKTTCVAVSLALIMVLYPNDKTLFIRKTDTDVVEIVAQVRKILLNPIMQRIVTMLWGTELELVKDSLTEINTNLSVNDPRGVSQLVGMGTKSSITGKHFDRVFTDDIVNQQDRISRAERERTKYFYQELQNVKNRGGRIFNTGTPWHKDDAFTLMPSPRMFDCYTTGLITADKLEDIRQKMSPSLFAANYELRHIASDSVLFLDAQTGADPSLLEQGESHIDASYGGDDYTAFTIVNKKNGKYYVMGKLRHKHIDECEDEFIALHNMFNCKILSCEDNGDKGYLAKDLRAKGVRVLKYHESMNKYAKIASYLKSVWPDVIFCEGTDRDYINQILEYNIDAEHDDAPDSLASLIRKLWKKKEPEASLLQFL